MRLLVFLVFIMSFLAHMQAVRVEARGVHDNTPSAECPQGLDKCGVCGGDDTSCCGPAGACSHHGTCSLDEHGCLCDVGFTGRFCGRSQDMCQHVDCGDHGRCMRDTGTCACRPGWFGDSCNRPTCSYRGVYNPRTHACRCLSGWGGDACEHCAVPANEEKSFVCMGLPRAGGNHTAPAPIPQRRYILRTIPTADLELYLTGKYGRTPPGAPAPAMPNTFIDEDEEWLLGCACNVLRAQSTGPSSLTDSPQGLSHQLRGVNGEECQAFLEKLSEDNDYLFDPATTNAEGLEVVADRLNDDNSGIVMFLLAITLAVALFIVSATIVLLIYKTVVKEDLLLMGLTSGLGKVTQLAGVGGN